MLDNITVNAQSSVCIRASKTIYFDPFKIEKETHDADLIFITHEHFDHLSPEDYRKVANEGTLFVVPKSVEGHMKGLKYETMVPGEKKTVLGFDVEAVSAYNTNKNYHKKESGWLGYVVDIDGTVTYVPGDTDHTEEAEKVRCDLCFMPIGGTYTMTAPEAAQLVNIIRPKTAIPYHYGTVVGKKSDGEVFANLVSKDIEVKMLLSL